jgi:hypothetical protein
VNLNQNPEPKTSCQTTQTLHHSERIVFGIIEEIIIELLNC